MNILEKKLIASMAAVVILLIAAGTFAFQALNEMIELNQQLSNTRAMLTEIESTISDLQNLSSDQRGYMADAADALEHVRIAGSRTRARLQRIRSLAANNSRQQERLSKVEPAIYEKFEKINTDVALRRKEALSTDKAAALSDQQDREVGSVASLLGEMKSEEQEALQKRVLQSDRSIRTLTTSFGVLFTLIVSLLVLGFFLVKREMDTQKQLRQQLGRLAMIDELTGLYNRREINRRFDDEFERFQRYKQPFSLILVDIDHFKRVNDKYGHPAGDKVIQYVAATLTASVRAMDIAGRYGGEEFAVVLPNTGSADAFVIGDRLRRSIAAEPVRMGDGPNPIEVSVTISVGIATVDEIQSKEEIIQAADSALYRAKDEGRNRAVLFSANGHVPLPLTS